MQVYSGSTNPVLAKKLAKALSVPFGAVELTQFPNQECRVWVSEKNIAKKVVIMQSFSGNPNNAILEFCLLVDALRRFGAQKIIAVIPWMGYCVQDKVFRSGEPLSAKVVVDLIQAMKVDQVITIDLHNETIEGFFSMPVTHLSAVPAYIAMFNRHNNNKQKSKKAKVQNDTENGVDIVISPDVGAMKKTTRVAHELGLPIAVINKKRDLRTGKVEIVGIDGIVNGKKALIVDDFISTGSTLIQTADYLKEKGVEKVVVAVTHHLFIPGVHEKLRKSKIDQLYITDTVEPENKIRLSSKSLSVEVVSVAKMLSEKV